MAFFTNYLFWQGVLAAFLLQAPIAIFLVLRKRRRLKKQAERERVHRETVFTLPDRENSFLKDRLNTRLRPAEPNGTITVGAQECGLKLAAVRETLSALKAMPLSVAERLATSAISRGITACAVKDELTAEEVRQINECFCDMLKLAAKYSL